MKHSKLSLALAGLIGVGAIAAADDVMAMSYHVQGDRIFLSGGVTYADVVSLPALLAKAQAEGRPIREVVLRTSNGGALIWPATCRSSTRCRSTRPATAAR